MSFAFPTSADTGTSDSPHKAFCAAASHRIHPKDITGERAELRYTMHNKITCIEYDAFMDEFVPEPVPQPSSSSSSSSLSSSATPTNASTNYNLRSRSRSRCVSGSPPSQPPTTNPLKSVPLPKTEVDMYDTIISALNKADLCPGYQFASTPHKGDPSEDTKQAVDCGLYPSSAIPRLGITEDGGFGRTDWLSVEIAIECKMHATDHDPFDERMVNEEPNAETRRSVLGQILSYMELIFRRQQRTFQFMLLFIGGYARIVRVDRSGLFATKKIDYRAEGNKLAVFLWRYSRLSAALRGHDTTAVRLEPDSPEAQRMRDRVKTVAPDDYVAQAFKNLLDEEWAWWKLTVPDEVDATKSRVFLVAKPHFQAPGVVGRATRGHIALEATPGAGDDFVYLKDAWRVVVDTIQKEGVVLEKLRENDVPHVPTLVCHGDIAGQRTVSQAVWPKYHPGEECKLKEHQHYRLVVKEVGKPLDQFENGYELVLALWCCITAHAQAYEIGVIHRDISAGNLLLYKGEDGWEGLLNDWELSKELDQQTEEGRQPDRTGTWQFMSARALNNHTKTIVVQDELESFFHVLIYLAIRLLPHNCEESEVPQLLYDYFDDYTPHTTGHGCGRTKYNVMCSGIIALGAYNRKKAAAKGEVLKFFFPGQPETSVETTGQATGDPAARPVSTTADSNVPIPEPKLEHPLNHIIQKLLSWFCAYYALQMDNPSKPAPRKEDSGDEMDGFMRIKARAKARAQKRVNATHPSSSQAAPALSGDDSSDEDDAAPQQSGRGKLQRRADRLNSHAAVLNVLDDALTKKGWPKADRCPDKKPKKGWRPKQLDQVPKAATIQQSRKRGSEVLDNPSSSPSKRSRI
ncbi:hypothetical protein OH77DRAFT_1518030 [Trametes cingulata]|nr:hypothetical protein OH77DRAFT_1518030 [Trametes cingulata]